MIQAVGGSPLVGRAGASQRRSGLPRVDTVDEYRRAGDRVAGRIRDDAGDSGGRHESNRETGPAPEALERDFRPFRPVAGGGGRQVQGIEAGARPQTKGAVPAGPGVVAWAPPEPDRSALDGQTAFGVDCQAGKLDRGRDAHVDDLRPRGIVGGDPDRLGASEASIRGLDLERDRFANVQTYRRFTALVGQSQGDRDVLGHSDHRPGNGHPPGIDDSQRDSRVAPELVLAFTLDHRRSEFESFSEDEDVGVRGRQVEAGESTGVGADGGTAEDGVDRLGCVRLLRPFPRPPRLQECRIGRSVLPIRPSCCLGNYLSFFDRCACLVGDADHEVVHLGQPDRCQSGGLREGQQPGVNRRRDGRRRCVGRGGQNLDLVGTRP